jgi:hypothetical protein
VVAQDAVTPLHFAAMKGQAGCVEALAPAVSNINATGGKKRRTAIAMAANGGHMAICGVLLANGADPTRADRDGMLVHEIAEESGHSSLGTSLRAAAKAARGAAEAADSNAASAADVEAVSAAGVEVVSAADVEAVSAADVEAVSAADVEAASAADVEAVSAAKRIHLATGEATAVEAAKPDPEAADSKASGMKRARE